MIATVAKWVGTNVQVFFRPPVPTPTPTTGKLLQIDDSGLLLETEKGQVFVPMTAVLCLGEMK